MPPSARARSVMRLRIHRTDGKTGRYVQSDPDRSAILLKRFDPDHLFRSGPIVIGVHNPFSIINADEICWIEIESEQKALTRRPSGIEQIRRIAGRAEYEELLAKQWPLWMKYRKGRKGELLEALVELSLRSGEAVFLHVFGVVDNVNIVDELFGAPAICADSPAGGTLYINPKGVTRARIYHSKDRIEHLNGFWMAEAEDI